MPLFYNISAEELADRNFADLYSSRRRDALFGFAYKEPDGSLILGRDHLGNVPLFYRLGSSDVRASFFMQDLVLETDTVSEEGLRTYLSIGSVKITPLLNELRLVPPGTVLRISLDGKEEILYQYKVAPKKPTSMSRKGLLQTLDQLLSDAAERTLTNDSVGLYLSGGIDSALTGMYVARAGASLHGYTATPWGMSGTETNFARINAKRLSVGKHEIRDIKTAEYSSYVDRYALLSGNPVGTPSQMGIACILTETDLKAESQVYFGQNADAATCSMPDQNVVFFSRFLPRSIRALLHPNLAEPAYLDRYVAFRTSGLLHASNLVTSRCTSDSATASITLAGMLFGHTPVDGDIIIMPALKGGVRVSNLFYDMDLVEFLLGLPWYKRLSIIPETRLKLGFSKRILKQLAAQHLPRELVRRKKGLTIPENRDAQSRAFFDSLPLEVGSISLKNQSQRFSAEVLRRWTHALPIQQNALQSLFSTKTP